MNEPRLVEFFFVGVGKCGTSWVYDFFKRNNLFSVPSLKETYLIDLEKESQSKLIKKMYKSQDKMCDFSNLYYWDEDNPIKIRKYNPEAKIIITVRKPSSRIVSHFGFLQRNGLVKEKEIKDYLNNGDEERIVDRSYYRKIISRYKGYFSNNKILILPLELLEESPQKYADYLLKFMGQESFQLKEEDTTPVLKKSKPRIRFLSLFAKKLAELIRKLGFLTLLGKLKSYIFIQKILFKEDNKEVSVDFGNRKEEINKLDIDYRLLLEEIGI